MRTSEKAPGGQRDEVYAGSVNEDDDTAVQSYVENVKRGYAQQVVAAGRGVRIYFENGRLQ